LNALSADLRAEMAELRAEMARGFYQQTWRITTALLATITVMTAILRFA
jgi:hypothetical protein